MAKVKCGECGFIAVRVLKTRELIETEDRIRCDGKISGVYEYLPICFTNGIDVKEEIEILRKSANDEPTQDAIGGFISPNWAKHIEVLLNMERECSSFTKWWQGFTPKEHKEMIDREAMLEWQRKERKDDKKWRIIELVVIVTITLIAAAIGWIARGSN